MTGQSKQGITCTHCGSDSFVKYGYRPAKDGKKTQRYRCNECKKTFVPVDGRKLINADIRKKIVFKEYTDGKSLRGSARSAEVSHRTAARWLREIANESKDIGELFCEGDDDDDNDDEGYEFEIDEMWHFLLCKSEKLWIIKIIDRKTGKVIDYIIGHRDEETLRSLYDKLKIKLKSTRNITWYSDNWIVFNKVFSENNDTHIIGKKYTHNIEGNNSNTRHYLGRFHRRTKIVSRSKEMVDISLKLLFLRQDYPEQVSQYLTPIFPTKMAA